MRVQRGNIQQGDVVVHTGFGIDITAQSKVSTTKHIVHPTIFASDPLITREGVDDILIGQNTRFDFYHRIGLTRS